MNQRFGKSQLMQELAKRFPGKVVHVTPENLPNRQREPMIGDVVVDEGAPEGDRTVYTLLRDGQFREVTKAEYDAHIAKMHRRSGKTGMVAIATAPTPALQELMEKIFQPEQEDEPSEVFMPNDVALGDHEERDRRTAEMKRKQRDAQYEHHKAYMADPERQQRLFAHHMKREAEIDAILNPPRGWLHRLLLG